VEAVAIFTLKRTQAKLNDGDILLVCDAGGETTHLALFKVQQANPLMLFQMHCVQGIGIGGRRIDLAFVALVKQRLLKAPDASVRLPRDLPKMLAADVAFETSKRSFGCRSTNHLEFCIPHIPREGLIPTNFNDSRLSIKNGRMIFSKLEIKALFDKQVDGIIQKIDGQLKWMQESQIPDQVVSFCAQIGLREYSC
jgi:hypothetical protein